MPPAPPEEIRWFALNVQPHVSLLRAWLRSRFSRESEIDDIVQESCLRLLQAKQKQALLSPKAFLFAVARNLAKDRIRRGPMAAGRECVPVESIELLDESDGVAESVARNQELELLTEAIQRLPKKCRRIFTMRKLYGLSQEEIATRLGVSQHTVSAQLTIGVHKCMEFFQRFRKELEP